MSSLARRVLALVLLSSTLVLLAGPGTASACSCAQADPVSAAAAADVVFTGSLVGHEGGDTDPVWTFAVDGWVKGDIPGNELVVQGQDYGFGCGVPFEWVPSPVAVFAERDGDDLISIGCSPTPGRAEFARLLDAAAAVEPTGTGMPAAMVVGRSSAANLRILDDAGELLLQADLDIDPVAGAHCPGTSLAAFWSFESPLLDSGLASAFDNVSIVDLATMDVVEQRELRSPWISSRDDMVCLDGGDRVVTGRGFGPDEGTVTAATSNRDPSLDVSRDFSDVSRALVHPSGTVTLLPSEAGGSLRTLSDDDLEPLADIELDPTIAATHGAFSPDGSELAVLVTISGNDMRYDTDATHVLVVDMVDGVVDGLTGLVELESGTGGRAKWIEWFDDSTWAVERETDSSKIIAVHARDGGLLGSTDVGWGWGLVPLDGQILRARDGGVELIDRAGTSTELTPEPLGPGAAADLAIASMVDAPPIVTAGSSGIEPLVLRDGPMAGEDRTVGSPARGVGEAPDEASTNSVEGQSAASDNGESANENSGGIAWPVVVIGGIIIVAGLVAVRREFANMRRRRRRSSPQ